MVHYRLSLDDCHVRLCPPPSWHSSWPCVPVVAVCLRPIGPYTNRGPLRINPRIVAWKLILVLHSLVSDSINKILKPIFHCDAKTLALGRHIGQYRQRESFALGIPTCWYLKTLKFALPQTRMLKFAFLPMRASGI